MNDQTTRSHFAGSDVFSVTVTGDIASFVIWKERLGSVINGTVAPYALFADGQQRFVSFRVEMLPDRPMPSWLLVGSIAKKQAAWLSVIAPPLLRIYWLTISDTDAVKWDVVRSRLESWLDASVTVDSTTTKVELTALVVLHVESQAQIGGITSIGRVQQQLIEKIRSLSISRTSQSSTAGNVHCFSFQPFNKNDLDPCACDRLAASLHSLLAIQAIERVRHIEEIARVERERCCRAAMAAVPLKGAAADERLYFANMFLLEEAVARGYAALSLHDDALARLDIIDAVLSQSAANCFCMAGRPAAVWISECLAHGPSHVDCVRLVPTVESDWPTSPCPLMLLENGRHPLIETRAELLSRQAAVIFRMAAANPAIPSRLSPAAAATKLSLYALQVAHSVTVESRQLSIAGQSPKLNDPSSQNITDAFIFLLFCETAAACQVLASSSVSNAPALQNPVNLSMLGHHALRGLQRLGRRSGFLAGSTKSINESESLHSTVSILQLLRFRSAVSTPRTPNGGEGPIRPETHSDRLARVLTSSAPDNFVAALIDLAESLLATFKSSGFRRWARQIAFELAEIYVQAVHHGCSLSSSGVAAAEPLLLDCVGAWLASRQYNMAVIALKMLANECYATSPSSSEQQIQQIKKRLLWTWLHIDAYSFPQDSNCATKIASLSRQLEKSSTLLSGNFLFTCCDVDLLPVKNTFSVTIQLKLRSAFQIVVENCSVEVVLRMASVLQPATYGRQSFDSISEDDNLTANGSQTTLPPFRPDVVLSNGVSRESEETVLLKTSASLVINPNCLNNVEFRFDIPPTADYESGALLYFLRATVNLYGGAVNVLCGVSLKSPKPLVFRPPDEVVTPPADGEDRLCEISLTDASMRPAHNSTENDIGSFDGAVSIDGLSRAAFGAEFSIEPVFASGATIIFVIVDVMQLMLSEASSQLVDPIIAVEHDGDEPMMLHHPIFDHSLSTRKLSSSSASSSSSSSSIVVPLMPAEDQPILPMILARLTWRLPAIPPETKEMRIILSCTVRRNGDASDVDDEDRLTITSQHFDLAAVFAAKSVNKLSLSTQPKQQAMLSASANETSM